MLGSVTLAFREYGAVGGPFTGVALVFDLWGVIVGVVIEAVGAVEVVTVKAGAVDVGAVLRDVGEAVGVDVRTGACTVSIDAAVAVTVTVVDGVVTAGTATVGVSSGSADAA